MKHERTYRKLVKLSDLELSTLLESLPSRGLPERDVTRLATCIVDVQDARALNLSALDRVGGSTTWDAPLAKQDALGYDYGSRTEPDERQSHLLKIAFLHGDRGKDLDLVSTYREMTGAGY